MVDYGPKRRKRQRPGYQDEVAALPPPEPPVPPPGTGTARLGPEQRALFLAKIRDEGQHRRQAARSVGVSAYQVAAEMAEDPNWRRAVHEAEAERDETPQTVIWQDAVPGRNPESAAAYLRHNLAARRARQDKRVHAEEMACKKQDMSLRQAAFEARYGRQVMGVVSNYGVLSDPEFATYTTLRDLVEAGRVLTAGEYEAFGRLTARVLGATPPVPELVHDHDEDTE